MRLGKEFHN
ncbi:hypothetical protein [Plasmodium yoelii yoelii]|uniref:Uncharacterized protein n=1 Tax=Plasmodium yoelii yoelii TaxID=73239 RepID=Q7RE58_PLAYO|nr:hypothetical protein [Plasmodium yoelii yoelii]